MASGDAIPSRAAKWSAPARRAYEIGRADECSRIAREVDHLILTWDFDSPGYQKAIGHVIDILANHARDHVGHSEDTA